MGRKSWEAIPMKYRPLDDRLNIVLTRDKNYTAEVSQNAKSKPLIYSSMPEAMSAIASMKNIGEVFVIGG